MKRTFNIIISIIILIIVPFTITNGQEKKSEQKIKIVIDDGSGTKVVIDTIFYGIPKPDSLKLKDGTVIYLKQTSDANDNKHHESRKHIMVTASADEKNPCKEFTEVTVVSPDSLQGDSETEKSRFVIAKDGMVVTIEGNDEARAEELAKEIENILDIKREGTGKKESGRTESENRNKK
jgi:hypothetical protein